MKHLELQNMGLEWNFKYPEVCEEGWWIVFEWCQKQNLVTALIPSWPVESAFCVSLEPLTISGSEQPVQMTSVSTVFLFFFFPSEGTGGNVCQKCRKSFPDDQYSQHLVSTFENEQENGLCLISSQYATEASL